MDPYVPRFHRVYIVDDHDIVRRGLRDLVDNARDIDVVGDSGSAQQAVAEILRLDADVILLDLQLQDGSGVEVCRAVRSARPSVTAVLLTAAEDEKALAAAVLAGAAAYLVKLNRSTDIVRTIRRLRPGTSMLDGASVERARRLLRSVIDSLEPPVTDDEILLLDQVLEGRTDSQVAAPSPVSSDEGTADLVPLVARVTEALLRSPSPVAEPGTGRHRRTD